MTWFDESRLDDHVILARYDHLLRPLAESGARVRRESTYAAETLASAVAATERAGERPRAVIAVGPDSRLLRAVLEPWCPVPFVAWPGAVLPGWVGSLDLVVVLAPDGADPTTAAALSEANRRGAQIVLAAPPNSVIAEHAAGRWTTVLPVSGGDQLATAVVALEYLDRVHLGPSCAAEPVASALDDVAVSCSPLKDLAVNPAKALAIALADANPVVWGGTVLAARAARRVAEALRRSTGRSALAGDVAQLLPILESAPPRDVFADPVDGQSGGLRPMLVVLDDGADSAIVREQRGQLVAAAALAGVRVETVTTEAANDLARYAALVLTGRYLAEYLRVGLVDE